MLTEDACASREVLSAVEVEGKLEPVRTKMVVSCNKAKFFGRLCQAIR